MHQFTGIAVNALGHGDPDWIQAITQQANTLTHVSNIFYTIPQGDGGIYSATKDFLQSLRVACDVAGSLLVFDESNGWFETQTKICLSISNHRPEHWQPSWSGKYCPDFIDTNFNSLIMCVTVGLQFLCLMHFPSNMV
ncbi:hypothetical protein POM88_026165 [Heracleum sosnowskyi]|uniref:Uncharacterized protein n=1 Tax=Heracleum sosnowskyi TaxID=360622 RepID=A0AAD8I6F9_9APIA|nr:hypothetical protein POM88_026165 [Heracleum sosnowskyi]